MLTNNKTPIQILHESLDENPETTVELIVKAVFALTADEEEEEEILEDESDTDDELDPFADEDKLVDPDASIEDLDIDAVEDALDDGSDKEEEVILPEVQKAIEEFFRFFHLVDQNTMSGKRLMIIFKTIPTNPEIMKMWLEKYARLSLEAAPV